MSNSCGDAQICRQQISPIRSGEERQALGLQRIPIELEIRIQDRGLVVYLKEARGRVGGEKLLR